MGKNLYAVVLKNYINHSKESKKAGAEKLLTPGKK